MTYAICKIQSTSAERTITENVRINIGRKKKSDPPAFRTVPNMDALNRLFDGGKDVAKAGFFIRMYQMHSTDGAPSYRRLSVDEWENTYKPVMNGDARCPNFKSISYEEAAEIAQDPARANYLWTEVQAENVLLISNGWHYVNRQDYFITEVPFAEGDNIEVYDEPEPSMVDDVNDGYSTLIHKDGGLLIKRLHGDVDNFKKYIRKLARTRYNVTLDRTITDLDELVDEFHSQTEAMGVEIELY